MRSIFVIPALVFAASLLYAQSPVTSNTQVGNSQAGEDPASAHCVVIGRVVTAAEGNPLKSARIALMPEHERSHTEIYAATSDNNGRFMFKHVPPGKYRFFASHSGFVEQHYKAMPGEDGPIFSLSPGQKLGDVLFRLVAAAVITGRVNNEDGEPMQRVQVVALQKPSEEELEDEAVLPRKMQTQMQRVGSAESDDRGQYRIFGLNPGEYYLRVEDEFQPDGRVAVDESYWLRQELGSDYGSSYYPGVAQLSQAQAIPIKAGEEVQADLAMHRVKTVEIAGRVIGAAGPAANSFVRLEPADTSDSDFDRQDSTDEKGNFRLRSVPEGTYYIVAYQREEGGHVFESRARQKIDVGGENIESLTISLTVGTTIQGRIRIDGTSSVKVDQIRLMLASADEEGPMGGSGEVKKDGSFEIKSVHEGNYTLGLWGIDRDGYVKSIRRGPDDVLEKGLQIEGGASGRIDIVISSDGAQLDGSVTDDDGPVVGARIRIVPDPLTQYNRFRIQRTATDQLGHFSVNEIAPGKYKLTAKPMESSGNNSYKSDPQTITLSESDHKTVQVKLEKQQEQ